MPVHTWDEKSGIARRARRCILLVGCKTPVSAVEVIAVIPTPCPSLQCWGVSLSVLLEVDLAASVSKHFINIVLGGAGGGHVL